MASRISQFPELTAMSRIDDGFMGPPVAFYAPRTDPDARYDVLNGVQRLNTLEEALSSTRIGLDDDPAQGAGGATRSLISSMMTPERSRGAQGGACEFHHARWGAGSASFR
jgi:hypothetical protein